MKKAQKEQEKQSAIARLRELLPPGSTVHTILRHRSRSGMQHAISIIANSQEISHLVASAIGSPLDSKWGGIKVGGCGMDMGYSIVHELAYALYPQGFGCIGEDREKWQFCPSNDHLNGDRDYTPHENHATSLDHICVKEPESCKAVKHWHKSGGYALKHKWL